jgi:polysaccharide biosynthesis transport protein
MVSATPVRDTQLIRVTVQHTQPAVASLVANALAVEFSEQNLSMQRERYAASIQSLEAQLATLDSQIVSTSARLETEELALASGAGSQAERDRLEALLVQNQGTRANLLASYEMVRLAEAQSLSNITQVDSAPVPEYPILPRTLQNTLLAAVVGLMAAVGVVFLLEAMDDT